MTKIFFDLTDLKCGGHSTGLKRLEANLYRELKKIYSPDILRGVVFCDGSVFDCTDENKIELEQKNHFNESSIVLSVGQSWACPTDAPRISNFKSLRKSHGVKFFNCCTSMIMERIPQWTYPAVAFSERGKFIDFILNESDVILCYSRDTAKDLSAYCEELSVSPRGSIEYFRMGDDFVQVSHSCRQAGRSTAESNQERDFILYVSTLEKRKNHEVIYRAYRYLREKNKNEKLPKVVFVGKLRWGVDDLLRQIKHDPLVADDFVVLNYVSDSELRELYHEALFCVYPSLYEGWGLPVGEALSLGKLVIASDAASIPEVGRDSVIYHNPHDVRGWAESIKHFSSKSQIKRTLRGLPRYQSTSWESAALDVRNIIDNFVREID